MGDDLHPLLKRFLLAGTVNRPQPQYEITAINPDHIMLRKRFCQNVKSNAIINVIKRRHQHKIIGDDEISIAGR